MKTNLRELDLRVEQGLLTKQAQNGLSIYNYTSKCQYDNVWDKYTVMARGLIIDDTGEIVAWPFPKFFNIEELLTRGHTMPESEPEITVKLDGSLGLLVPTSNGYAVATRGSFVSDQAIWATNWIGDIKGWSPTHTYLFEIVYPENRIVIDYGNRAELILIGLVDLHTGKILPHYVVEAEAKRLSLSCTQRITIGRDIVLESLKNPVWLNEEGFVLFWPEEQVIAKAKYREYFRLHQLRFQLSAGFLFDMIIEGKEINTEHLPTDWAGNIKRFVMKARDIQHGNLLLGQSWTVALRRMSRKEAALKLLAEVPDLAPIVFRLLDDKDAVRSAWKLTQEQMQASDEWKVMQEMQA